MKTRSIVLILGLAQCKGSSAPAPGPAAFPAPGATPASKWVVPGPAVGAPLPAFEAPDQGGQRRAFDDLRGPNGLLLNFNRSVVW